jgi:hypothetical protein
MFRMITFCLLIDMQLDVLVINMHRKQCLITSPLLQDPEYSYALYLESLLCSLLYKLKFVELKIIAKKGMFDHLNVDGWLLATV